MTARDAQRPDAGDDTRGHDAVLVVGSANRDYVSFAPRLPGPGETILATGSLVGTGGKGGNQAVAAARMGARVQLLGRVGEDRDGEAVLADLTAAGVGVSLVRRSPGAATGRAFVTVDDDGRNCIVVAPGANAEVSPDDVEVALRGAGPWSVVVLQAEIPLPTVQAAVAATASASARAVVNLAPYAPLPDRTLALCDPLVVNESEVAELTGRPVRDVDGARQAARDAARRCRSVVVTLGADGAVVARADDVVHLPAPVVPVVDTTGAGDALVGALAARLAQGHDLVEAARWGVWAGALSVGTAGTQASYADARAVEAALREDG